MKVVFLDRDGTLIKDKHYLKDPQEVEFFPDTISALKVIQKLGYSVIVITNQSGIGRGFFTLKEMHSVHQQIQLDLLKAGLNPVIEFAYCPHTPEDNCKCRKPETELVEALIKKYDLNPKDCFFLGDKISDYETGKKMNIPSSLVYEKKDQLPFFENLLAFATSLKK